MKKFYLFSLVALFSIIFCSSASASTGPSSFYISGTVFYDQNGNGWHDVNETQYISSAKSCKSNVIAHGTRIKAVSQKGKSVKTNYYSLNICGNQASGQYSGAGVYYQTKSYAVGTKLTVTLIVPKGWRSTWPNPVVVSANSSPPGYVFFAMARS